MSVKTILKETVYHGFCLIYYNHSFQKVFKISLNLVHIPSTDGFVSTRTPVSGDTLPYLPQMMWISDSTIKIGDFQSDFLKQEKFAPFQMDALPIEVIKCTCSFFSNNFKITNVNKINCQDVSLQTHKNRSLQKNCQCEPVNRGFTKFNYA